jgi:hypothetical protein
VKGQLFVQDRSGHTTIEWDTEVTDGPLRPEVAEAKFAEMMRRGAFAFAETAPGEREQIKTFDPQTQTKVSITPQIAGGR